MTHLDTDMIKGKLPRCKATTKWQDKRCEHRGRFDGFCKKHAPKSNGDDVRAGYEMGFEAGVAFERSKAREKSGV